MLGDDGLCDCQRVCFADAFLQTPAVLLIDPFPIVTVASFHDTLR